MLPRIFDSNYVPLSATQAPVTGLTDILTPVNLLPNSDFSRSEGYDTIQTLTDISSISILPDINLNLARGKFNGTVTINLNSIRITGTITTANTTGHTIGLRYDPIVKSDKFYTAGATIIDYNNNAEGVSLYSIGSSSAVYDTQGKDGQTYHPVFIRKTNNPTALTSYYSYIFYPSQAADTTINVDVEFKDMRLYEGEFKNPPITTSLDVMVGQQLMLADFSQRFKGSAQEYIEASSTGWYRIVKMRNSGQAIYGAFFKGYVSKGTSSGGVGLYDIEAFISYSDGINHNSKRYALKVNSFRQQTGTNAGNISKFRLAYDSNNNIYLEAYYTNTGNQYNNKIGVFKSVECRGSSTLSFDDFVFPLNNYNGGSDTLIGQEVTPTEMTELFTEM